MSEKSFTLSTKVVIRDGSGRCLLLRRSLSSKGNPGKWEFPGGKAEMGERFDKSLLREVAEETGLTISLQRVSGAAESDLPDRKIVYLIMEARLVSGDMRLSGEHIAFAWVAPAELPTVDLAEQFRAFARSLCGE
jgi:8-oxo-dGTP diphosphatase